MPTDEDLDLILSWQEVRKLSKNLEISYQNVIYQVQCEQRGYRLRHAHVLVSENLEGQVSLWHQGKSLGYTTLIKHQRRTEIVSNKEKNSRVDEAIIRRAGGYKPQPQTHPWKRQGLLAMAARKRDAVFREGVSLACEG